MREGSAVAQINSSGQSVPHACVICAPTIELALSEAEKLAAAAVCSGVGARPCGKCRDCRKAAEHVHPDIITVSRLLDDKGRPKREIGVDQIRDVIADAQVLPNEAARKVYIIDRAETMNAAAQNAALKLLEEPPAGAVLHSTIVPPTWSTTGFQNSGRRKFWLPTSPECTLTAMLPGSFFPDSSMSSIIFSGLIVLEK